MFALIGFAVLLVIVLITRPFGWVLRYFLWFGKHGDVRSRELAKASHGAGLILIVMGVLGLVVTSGFLDDSKTGIAFLIAAVPVVWGLFWFCSSGYFVVRTGSAGALDNEPLVRGVIKCAAGLALDNLIPYSPEEVFRGLPNAPDAGVFLIMAGIKVLLAKRVCTSAGRVLTYSNPDTIY